VPAERRGRLRADVARVTRELAGRLEDLIRAAPEQWHLQQPNWPSDFAALDAIGKPHPRPLVGPSARPPTRAG
jgi:KDO2-lipid IV(A) lauroyltransferase